MNVDRVSRSMRSLAVVLYKYVRRWSVRFFTIRTVDKVVYCVLTRFSVDPVRRLAGPLIVQAAAGIVDGGMLARSEAYGTFPESSTTNT